MSEQQERIIGFVVQLEDIFLPHVENAAFVHDIYCLGAEVDGGHGEASLLEAETVEAASRSDVEDSSPAPVEGGLFDG